MAVAARGRMRYSLRAMAISLELPRFATRHRRWRPARVVALWLALATGCSHAPNGPAPLPPLHRTSAVIVTDSLGQPAFDVRVRLVSQRDSAGFAFVVEGRSDAQGVFSAVLIEGQWGVHGLADLGSPTVAGATFEVPGRTRAEGDTIVVRIALHTPSLARGRVLLGGRSDHSGTVVDCPPAPTAMATDSTGSYTMLWLPPGHWTITLFHTGFRLGLAPIDVTTPGASLDVPDVLLISDPILNALDEAPTAARCRP